MCHGIVRDGSSCGYRSRTLPRKQCALFASRANGIVRWISSWEYRFPHVLIAVSFVMVPCGGCGLANSSLCLHCALTVSFVGSPRKGYRSLACPRKVSRSLHCAPTVSFVGSPRKGYAPCSTVSFVGGLGFDLRVAGCYPAPLFP